MTAPLTKHAPKPKRRQSVRGHKGILRGSENAARLFWQKAAESTRDAKPDDIVHLPEHRRFGFDGPPTPPDAESIVRAKAWYRRVKEWHRLSMLRATPEQRAMLYWSSVDHYAMMPGSARPDPYEFGYDTFPTRPPEHPEPAYVREFSAIWRQVEHQPAHEALAAFGLTTAATADDVRRAYGKIVAAQRLHPDQGGDPAAFVRLTATRDRALSFVEAVAR